MVRQLGEKNKNIVAISLEPGFTIKFNKLLGIELVYKHHTTFKTTLKKSKDKLETQESREFTKLTVKIVKQDILVKHVDLFKPVWKTT